MHILTGKYKGRIIEMPKGIRPTQQKVRKAIFDILSERIKGAIFLELFAGSGAVGIEAFSNGASEVTFVENNKNCLKILKKNLIKLGIKNYYIQTDEALKAIKDFKTDNKKFDLIFLDPPYHHYQDLAKNCLLTLSNYDILNPNGFIIIQHYKDDKLPKSISDLILYKQYNYADNQLSLYEKG